MTRAMAHQGRARAAATRTTADGARAGRMRGRLRGGTVHERRWRATDRPRAMEDARGEGDVRVTRARVLTRLEGSGRWGDGRGEKMDARD